MKFKNTFLLAGLLIALLAPASAQAKNDSKPAGWIEKIKLNQQHVALGNAEVASVSGTTLTVTKEGKTYTVNTNSETKFRFRFWGKDVTISDIKVGHKVNVMGSWANDAKTVILAKSIRNLSVNKRFAVLIGKVLSILPDGFTMSTESEKRGNQTVILNSETKLVNRKQKTILKSDIRVDDRVMVKGVWDVELNTVAPVTQVKNFNLPLK
jgi:hypothetical protein